MYQTKATKATKANMFSATPMRTCRLSPRELSPPPIQRQDSARWYAANHNPPAITRQIPLGEEFAKVANERALERSKFVRGTEVELNYIIAPQGDVGKLARGTKGRVDRRIKGGWLSVQFGRAGVDKCLKVRTSNCRTPTMASTKPSYTVLDFFIDDNRALRCFKTAMCDILHPLLNDHVVAGLWAKMSNAERSVWTAASKQVNEHKEAWKALTSSEQWALHV